MPNFEEAYFGSLVGEEKPYNALKTLETDEAAFQIIESLLNCLIDHLAEIPKNCAEWKSIDHLNEQLEMMLIVE